MKSLVRRLHSGATEEQIKAQLGVMLDEADYSDVFLMEVQFIQEGIPQESIQELCDTHTRVLKQHLGLEETPEAIPGHPVHTFVQENRELTRTTLLENKGWRPTRGGPPPKILPRQSVTGLLVISPSAPGP